MAVAQAGAATRTAGADRFRSGPEGIAAIAAYGDGWIPIGGGGARAALPELRIAMEKAGRDPATLAIVPLGIGPDPGKIDYYESIGCTEVVFRVPTAGRDEVMPVLDDLARVIQSR